MVGYSLRQHGGFLCMMRQILPEQQKMRRVNPKAIDQAKRQPIEKTSTCALARDHVRREDKDGEPANRLNVQRDKVHGGYSHEKSKQGELKNQFPVQGSTQLSG